MAVTDSFTGTDDTILPTYSANWSILSSSALNNCEIRSNAVAGINNSGNIYTGRTWADDQYSQATVVQVPDQVWAVVVRGDGTAWTYYGGGIIPAILPHTRYCIWKYVAGTFTALSVHGSTTMAINDTVRLEVSGSDLTLKVNGATLLGPVTDSSIASGTAGIAIFHFAAANYQALDDWEGDDLATDVTLALSGSSCTGGHGTASPGIAVGL